MPGYLANMLARLGLDASDFNTGMSKAERSFQNFGKNLQQAGQAMTLAISAPLIGIAAGAIKASADMESLKMALTTITGNAGETANQLTRLKEVAKLPGLGFQEAVQGSVNLQAAGFSAEQAERSLKAFGNALATVGKGRADLEGVNLQLTQMINKPKVLASDLNPLRERLPQIAQMMKNAFGSAVSEDIQALGVTGKQFVERMITEFEKLPPMTGGFKNSIENLKDSLFLAAVEMGDALLPLAQKIADFAAGSVDHIKKLALAFQQMPEPMKNVAIGVGALAAAFPVLILALGTTITNLGVVTKSLSTLATVLGLSTVAVGPLALALGTLATGAVLAFSELSKATEKLHSLDEKFKKFIADTAGSTDNFEASHAKLDQALANNLISMEEYNKALAVLDANEKKAIGAGLGKQFEEMGIKIKLVTPEIKKTEDAVKAVGVAAKKTAADVQAFVGPIDQLASAVGLEHLTREALRLGSAWRGVVNAIVDMQDASTSAGKKLETFWSDQTNLVEDFRLEMELTAPAIANAVEVDPRVFEEQMERLEKANKKAGEHIKRDRFDLGHELELMSHRSIEAVERDLAHNIVSWKGWADTIKNVGKGFAEDFLAIMLKGLFKPLEDAFSRLAVTIGQQLDKALAGVWKALGIGGTKAGGVIGAAPAGAGGIPDDVWDQLGLGKIGGAETIGGLPGGASGPVNNAVGQAAGMGIQGITNLVTGAVSAVSGVIGNFQFAGMNKSLDIIVNHTLATANDLANLRRDEWDRETHLMLKLDDLWNSIRDVGAAIRGAGPGGSKQAVQVIVNIDSKTIWSGMANTAQLQGI